MNEFTHLANQDDRVSQRGVLPATTRLNLLSQYNSTNNSIEYKNAAGTVVFAVNLTTGVVTFATALTIGVAVTLTSTFTLGGISVSAPVKEIQMYILSGGTGGGATIATPRSYYTNSTTMVNLPSSRFTINPANYPGCTFLLEAVYRAGAVADPTHTMTLELYDVVAAATVTNSTISGTDKANDTPVASTVFPLLRGTTNFRGNLTTGARDYILRYKSSTTDFIDVYAAKLIIQY